MSSNLNAPSFEGKEIQLEYFFPDRNNPISNKLVATVGEGFEFTDLDNQELSGANLVDTHIDFSANSIILDFSESNPSRRFSSVTFNGYVFTDVSGTIPQISNVTIDETVTTLGLDSSDITFTEDSIEVNVEGLSFNTDTIAKLDVEFGETLSNVYVFSSGNEQGDQAVLDAIEESGYFPTLGVQTEAWDGSQADIDDYTAVVLLNNYNWSSSSNMPVAGQNILIDYVTTGGGLITGEWVGWNASRGAYSELETIIPGTTGGLYNASTSTTYTEDVENAILNEDLPDSFEFTLTTITDTESFFTPKEGATSFYSSSNTEQSGLVGWDIESGRVLSFSTLIAENELANPDYKTLFGNALDWVSDLSENNEAPTNSGKISGIKWNDLNGNGFRDSELIQEPGLAGVTIYLDQNNNGVLDADEPVTTTDESGKYEFTSLEPGTYIVREVIPQGFKQTFPFGSEGTIGDGFADRVVEFFDSGTGKLLGPHGGTAPNFNRRSNGIESVSTDVVLGDDNDQVDFLVLPEGSSITVEFIDETVIDRPGDDIFVAEFRPKDEQANVFVSSDLINFELLGVADGGTTTALDLADIGFTEPVRGVKIVALNQGTGTPGFELANIQVLPDSIASPDFYTVDVAEGETVENINFGNTQGDITSGNDSDKITSSPDNKGRSKGEPHLTTFDGIGYDFQGAGEFTLVKSNDSDLNIQIRYVQIDSRVTVATAVATEIEGQKVVIDSEGIEFDENGIPFVTRSTSDGTAKVTIDGVEVEIVSGGFIDVGNSRIYRSSGEKYTVVYAGEDGILGDGDDQLVVDYLRPGTINIVDVYLGDEQKGNITGLLGNLNDNPDDDIALPDSTVLPRPLEFDRLYGDYREAYRIKDISESLFTYAEGQNPDTFYNPNFPEALFTYANLDPEAKARGDAAALAAGYTPGTFDFESAAFDFAVTGDEGFLEGVESDPANIEPVPIIDSEDSNSETPISWIVTEDGTIGGVSSTGSLSLFLPLNLFVPNLQDIPFYEIAFYEKKIYAVASPQELYQFDSNAQQFEAIATVDRPLNALGFDNNGILYGAGNSNFFTIDPLTGQTNVIADLGSDFSSSGDISFDVEESVFYATSLGDNGNDLYRIALDGEATKIGSIGYERVKGLSFENDNLIGFSDNNRIIIDQNSGQGVLETTIYGINPVFGAASA